MIDAELYRVFLVVAQTGTISSASKRLFVSQPAISKAIKKLEMLSGCTLFHRSSRGVHLTTEGRILFDHVSKGFEQLDYGEKILKKLTSGDIGLVRIGISSTLCKHILIPHLTRFHKIYPGIRINIVNRTSTETLLQLREGRVDLCIVSKPENSVGLTCHDLLQIQDILVATKDVYTSIPSPLPVAELPKYPLMMLEEGNSTRSSLETFFTRCGVSLQVENEISSMDFLIEFAKIGIGIAPVVEQFVGDELRCGMVKKINLQPPIPPRQVAVVCLENIPLSTAAKTFITSICNDFSSRFTHTPQDE